MAINSERLLAALLAAGFTAVQLDTIADRALGVRLEAVTTETDPRLQVRALVAYALEYDLMEKLARMALEAGADRPAMQNLLFGGEQLMNGGGEQPNFSYLVSRIDVKLDQILAEQGRQAQQVAQMMQRQTDAERRLTVVEASTQRPASNVDRMIVFAMVALMVVLMLFTVYGTVFR